MEDVKFNLENIDKTFVQFKVGAKITGTVSHKIKEGCVINIGGKKDAYIPYEDLNGEELELGSTVEAVVVNTRDENTNAVVLSKKKADDIRKGNEMIGNLKVGDETKLVITEVVSGGLISKIGTFTAFIPASQVSVRRTDMSKYLNEQVTAVVLEIDMVAQKVIASMRAFEEKVKLNAEQAFWGAIYEGKLVRGTVARVTDFGVFVTVDGVDCLVHNSEVTYNRNEDWKSILEVGKEYEFKVIKLDKDAKRVSLSYKALKENPLTAEYAKYNVGDVVEGTVKKILAFGAIIDLGNGVDGMLHIKEASAFYVKNIYEVAKVGQTLKLKVIAVDTENLKISLSLKALQEDELNKYMSTEGDNK